MVFSAETVKQIDHSGLSGRYKEIFLNELLEPYLSPFMKTCTGVIIDSTGKQSHQIDIIIYDAEIIPIALFQQEAGVVPVEAALATIEVKSTLTASTLKDTIRKGISVKMLAFQPSAFKNSNPHNIPSYLFAFHSDLKKKTELDRLLEGIEKHGITYDPPFKAPIGGICVADKAFLYFEQDSSKSQPLKDMWHEYNKSGQFDEILQFISSILDSCYAIKQERKRISIQPYLFNENDF